MATVNTVHTLRVLGGRLNLPLLAERMRNVEYRPQSLNALVVRCRRPRATLLVFATGSVVVTGVRTTAAARTAARRTARQLQRAGAALRGITRPQLRNVVVAGRVGPVDLAALARRHRGDYCAELFPAAQFHIRGIALTVFANGKWFASGRHAAIAH